MTIKEEFEKAFSAWYDPLSDDRYVEEEEIALWAAKWFGERIAKEAESNQCAGFVNGLIVTAKIRQLSKELE